MSEFLAEARILVRPDTSRFRADLEAQLKSVVARPIKVPVVPVVSAGFATAVAGTAAFSAAQSGLAAATTVSAEALASATTIAAQYAGVVDLSAVSTQSLAAAQEKQTIATLGAAAAEKKLIQTRGQALKGVVAQGAATLGLRAGTLAASSAFIAATVGVLAFTRAVQSAAQLETELNVFRVTAGATADEMDRVAASAKQLGRDITLPGVTANDAAQAMTELAKAGLSVRDSMAAARGTLQLATAAQIDNVQATELVAGALNSFKLSGEEATTVADLLAGAAKESQGSIDSMGTALQQASAVAKLAGVSIGDTVTFLTQLSRAGIDGGRAGTSLRVAILRLINPTDNAAKKLEELKVSILDPSTGALNVRVFTDIAASLQKYSKEQQLATLATIFGSDAIRAAAIIGNDGTISFDKLNRAVTEFGLSQQQSAARASGFQGDVENLKNQMSGLGLTIGEVAKGPLSVFVKTVADSVSTVNDAAIALGGLGSAYEDFSAKVNEAIPGSAFLDKQIKDFGAQAPKVLFPVLGSLAELNFLLEQTGVTAQSAAPSVQSLADAIAAAVETGKKTGGEVGLNQTLTILDVLIDKLKQGTPEAQKMAAAVAEVRRKIFEAQGVRLFPEDVRKLFPPALLDGSVAAAAGKRNKDEFLKATSGDELFSVTFDAWGKIGLAIEIQGASAAETARKVISNIVKVAKNALGALDEAFDVAAASGDRSGQLAALRAQAQQQQKLIDAADKAASEIGAGNKGFATAVAARRKARKALVGINSQIDSIEGQIASDATQAASRAKQRADAAKQARDDRDRAFLDSVGVKEGTLRNNVLKAGLDKALGNDIAANKALRAFYVAERKLAQKTIQDAKLRQQTVAGFTADILQIDSTINGLKERQANAAKEARQKTFDTVQESAQLDIDFFSAKNDRSGEIAARKRLIVSLRAEQDLVKKGTVEYKKLRNEIDEQQRAIDELTASKKKEGQSFAAATFEFLQAQQGFAANLLGNLIPGGATGGLVGGGQRVGAALQPAVGSAEARSLAGPTAGQGNATNHLLAGILQQLKTLNGDNSAPEAQRQNRWQRAVMDY